MGMGAANISASLPWPVKQAAQALGAKLGPSPSPWCGGSYGTQGLESLHGASLVPAEALRRYHLRMITRILVTSRSARLRGVANDSTRADCLHCVGRQTSSQREVDVQLSRKASGPSRFDETSAGLH